MTPIRIDFAAPSVRRTLFHAGPAGWALAGLSLLLCLGTALTGWQLLAQQRADDAELGAAGARANARTAAVLPPQALRVPAAQAAAVNAVVLQLNLPWRALHDAIADATPDHIALLALEPEARKRTIRITAEARSGEEMTAYVERLKQQRLFAAVALTRHEADEQNANKPIRFQLDAEWRAQ